MSRLSVCLLFVGLALLAACGGTADLDQPPDIRYGEDVCERCNMIISEPRFAAAYVTAAGDVRRFDDVGGMAAYYHENADDVARFWVHDYDTAEWLDGRDAHYVLAGDLVTPMGFGLVAVSDEARADELAGEWNGRVLDFDGLLAHAAGGSMEMPMGDVNP